MQAFISVFFSDREPVLHTDRRLNSFPCSVATLDISEILSVFFSVQHKVRDQENINM